MFNSDNWIGMLLLGLCVVVGGVLVWSIATGTRYVYNGPDWLPPVLTVLFIGASLYSLIRSRRR